uniref:C-type lectin domain-containing protein n=1 Tax=Cyprinus carpio carpio TaxID=630221 RepID=A0A9J8C0N0_CYPCA
MHTTSAVLLETTASYTSASVLNTPTKHFTSREMNANYENVDYLPSVTASGGKCSQYRGNSTEEQESEREVCPPKRTKVLLIVFAVCLVFALGGLCILGILYVRVSVLLSAKKTNGTNYKEEFYVLRNQHKKTLEKLSRLNHSTGCALCAVHWIHSGGKCYYYSTVRMNWTQSRDHCVTLGGHLVIINSKAEQDFVTSNVEETHWIGLNDLDTEGHWVWVNNQPVSNSVEFWKKRENDISEPDNWTKVHPDGEDCASLGHPKGETDFWMDAYCFEEKKFCV